MADLGRKDVTEQASNSTAKTRFHNMKETDKFYKQTKETVTPDSQKSTFDKAKETVTGKTDDAARAVQPEDQKSASQKVTDTTKDTYDKGTEQVSLQPIFFT